MGERDPYSRVEYRRLIAWPERIRREWPLLSEVLGSGPSRRVLELGCGPGEHARALADAGFEVVAVDRSAAMLSQATEAPVPANLRFVEGDIARIDEVVEGPFGAALCLGNTLPHLTTDEELAGFAGSLARVLEPGAPVLIQLLAYDRIHDRGIRALPVNISPHEGGELVFLRLMTPLPDGRVRFFPSTLLLRPGAEPPLVVEHSREVLLRGWRRSEVESALAGVGIATERSLGDFAGSSFDPATSQDLVLVARGA
jgi:glycine/sarcosine N-methyltransferase